MTTKPINKNCIISFANSNGAYAQRLARLSESLRTNSEKVDFLAWISEHALDAPLHADNPYTFKIYAFQKAIDLGYQNILWLDSSVFAVNDVTPIFNHIEANGYIMQEAGHLLGTWCNDETLKYFGITRDQAHSIRMIGNAGFLGLNIHNHLAKQFFSQWKQSMEDGMFKGLWSDHRHDMSCSSAICHKLNMDIIPGDKWFQYGGPYDKIINSEIIFKAQG